MTQPEGCGERFDTFVGLTRQHVTYVIGVVQREQCRGLSIIIHRCRAQYMPARLFNRYEVHGPRVAEYVQRTYLLERERSSWVQLKLYWYSSGVDNTIDRWPLSAFTFCDPSISTSGSKALTEH
jgi:hypothetical protein